MKSNPFGGLTHPSSSTLSDIQRRMVELTGKPLQLEPQPQRQTRSAPSTPPPPGASPNPILGDAALYGVAGLAVCGLAPHSWQRHTGQDQRRCRTRPAVGGWRRGGLCILEAINTSPGGFLSRSQMSALFHGHFTSSRIEAALEQLVSVGAIYQSSTQPSGGRPSTLWSATPETDCWAEGESYDESTLEETADEESMQQQT